MQAALYTPAPHGTLRAFPSKCEAHLPGAAGNAVLSRYRIILKGILSYAPSLWK